MTIVRLSPEYQARLSATRFKDLVSTLEGAHLSKELVTGLVNLNTNDTAVCALLYLLTNSAKVDAVSTLLREKCPSFFSDADRLRFKANELVRLAKTARDAKERIDLLDKSLEIYTKVAEYLNLPQICDEYQRQQYYVGIVKLALNYANKIDPAGGALLWHKNGRTLSDEHGRKLFGKLGVALL